MMEARARSLRHLAVNAPDPAAVAEFALAFGLETAERPDGMTVRCAGRDQDQIRVHPGPGRTVHHLALHIDPGGLDTMAAHLAGYGVDLVDPPAGADDDGLWLIDPDGNHVLLTDATPAPWAGYDAAPTNQNDRSERWDVARWAELPAAVAPRRLMHALLFTPDLAAMERFYIEALGLRLADRVPGKIAFLHGGDGDHHVFGFIGSDRPGLHHAAWEVADVDAVAIGAEQMAGGGWREGWGLGRHALGSNYFHYVKAPTGMWWEYSCDIDQVTDAWEGRDQDTRPWVWGPPIPEDFLVNTAER